MAYFRSMLSILLCIDKLSDTFPVWAAKTVETEKKSKMKDDFLIEGNSLVHLAIHKKGITHEYRMREGAHSWTYWRQSLPDVLEFVSMAFHQF